MSGAAMENATAVAEDERLCDLLTALSHPVRLALLRRLLRPVWLSEIRVAKPGLDGSGPTLSRQATKEHLDRLLKANLVVSIGDASNGRHGPRYVLNHREMYGLAETIRRLSRLRGDEEIGGATVMAPAAYRVFDIQPQALIMVKGPDEGKVYPLDPPSAGECTWTIGRQAGTDITLDHDAFVSSENTQVTWAEGSYHVSDLASSKNGTRLNFQPLEPGRPERLRTGDLIGIGQTILMFRG